KKRGAIELLHYFAVTSNREQPKSVFAQFLHHLVIFICREYLQGSHLGYSDQAGKMCNVLPRAFQHIGIDHIANFNRQSLKLASLQDESRTPSYGWINSLFDLHALSSVLRFAVR